jgi:hypothetical protein
MSNPEVMAALAEMAERLDRMEQKLDLILDSLPGDDEQGGMDLDGNAPRPL